MNKIVKIPISKAQRKGYSYCQSIDHPALFMDMRLGKTRVIIKDLLQESLEPVLIVGPYSALYGWEIESKFMRIHSNEINRILGTRKQRLKALQSLGAINLINREGFLACPEIKDITWKAVVIDESTCIANVNKRSLFYTTYFRNANRRYIATGTPAPETFLDYFQQLKFLNPNILGKRFNYYTFRNRYFAQIQYIGYVILREGERYLQKQLAKYCFFMTRSEAGLSDKKIYKRRVFKLPQKIRKTYEYLAKKFILDYKNDVNGKIVDIFKCTDHTIVKWSWLRYICSGIIKDADNQQFSIIDKSKLNVLKELLKVELKHSKIIIWCQFIIEMTQITELLKSIQQPYRAINGSVKVNDRNKYIQQFQNGDYDRIVLQSKCFDEGGATLNKADCSIFYSSPLGCKTRLQNEDRMVNAYLKESNLIIDLCAEDSVEIDILDSVFKKESKQNMMHRIVKRLQRGN